MALSPTTALIPATQATQAPTGFEDEPTQGAEVGQPAQVQVLKPAELRRLGEEFGSLFQRYAADRKLVEQKWIRSLRQYLGYYDPEVKIDTNRSRAYPRITRVKCISMLSRIMNLMFPGNERNWELSASPNAEMSPQDIMTALQTIMQKDQQAGLNRPITDAMVQAAANQLAEERAKQLATLIDDQLQEIGGDQTLDYIQLVRRTLMSGILYGLGVLRGPFVRTAQQTGWVMVTDPITGQQMPRAVNRTVYKPQYEFLPVWDFYPDMSAKDLLTGDGYFIRLVMTKAQLLDLKRRPDFFNETIDKYMRQNTTGNYRQLEFETELRSMGSKINVSSTRADGNKYEVIVWNGPISTSKLKECGVILPEGAPEDVIDAELWMVDGWVIKAAMNPWAALGVNVRTIHTFVFDEDDTSPVGNGIPSIMRDSQMSICAATRMVLDNASITCGPNIVLNLDLLDRAQDITSIEPYKIWYRTGTGAEAQFPAVQNVSIDAHLDELLKLIEIFMKFADTETFVGPATGGDMEKTPSEPMRTAAGASMLRGDAALPFKDIIRAFDSFTQSVIQSLVQFNKKFNPDQVQEGDFNVIARGATSLVAKEVRGMQLDLLATSMTPDEKLHVDDRKLVEARLASRDLSGLLVPVEEAERRKAAQDQALQQSKQMQDEGVRAEIRKTLAEAFKNITQGQKNSASADAAAVKTVLDMMEKDGEPDAAPGAVAGNRGSAAAPKGGA